jgi:hypothetical protein
MIRSHRNPIVSAPQTRQSPLFKARTWLWMKFDKVDASAIWQYGGAGVFPKDMNLKNLNSRKNKKAVRMNSMDLYLEITPSRYMRNPRKATTVDHASLAAKSGTSRPAERKERKNKTPKRPEARQALLRNELFFTTRSR